MNFKNMKKIKKIAAAALIMTALMSMQAQAAFIAAPGVEVGSDNEKQITNPRPMPHQIPAVLRRATHRPTLKKAT